MPNSKSMFSWSSIFIILVPLFISFLFFHYPFLAEMTIKLNTDKVTKNRSALLRALPPAKRSKGVEEVMEGVANIDKDSSSTAINPPAVLVPCSEEIGLWVDMMTASIRDLPLRSPEKTGLERKLEGVSVDLHTSPERDSSVDNQAGPSKEADVCHKG